MVLLAGFALVGAVIIAAGGQGRGAPVIVFRLFVLGLAAARILIYRWGARRKAGEIELTTAVLDGAGAARVSSSR